MIFHASSARWSELVGGEIVPMLAYPPDPTSFHGDFYYNTAENKLYRITIVIDTIRHIRRRSWMPIISDGC